MRITEYEITTEKKGIDLHFAVVADLHNRPWENVMTALEAIDPDIIVSPGDLVERLDGRRDRENESGFEFMKRASQIAPFYYSLGNHELCGSHHEMRRDKFPMSTGEITYDNKRKIHESGIRLLFDRFEPINTCNTLYIGGLSSGMYRDKMIPNVEFAREFAKLDGFKLLLCHHPEYYPKYLQELDIDLIISGHAHGGQWRFFGRGVFAPDQGLFPKLTSGIYNDRLIVSRGVANTAGIIPRIFNPCEVLSIHIISK